ncbi:glutamine amidotransferase [Microbacterium hominis]|uniref:Cytoplasmic protein n=1 Tax=Microbacterium hominis TaxID=162426 RepID=A0A7D4UAA3_9MICO|nr:glutamine amidotransferase [Microbacterium hominis]QKJ18243.1 cytoplasmic protein [Microbacterium hominis]
MSTAATESRNETKAGQRVLLVGESWFVYSVHQKGFDTFYTSEYTEGGSEFVGTLAASGHQVDRIPAHLIERDFPTSLEALQAAADVVVISDVGANSFLLSKTTFAHSRVDADRIEILRQFVLEGGAVVMVGGYMTFAGIDAKARWGRSALADVLPVTVLDRDDRVEVPGGIQPTVVASHPIVDGLDATWPTLLGLNEVIAKPEAQTLATAGDYPLVVVGTAGRGRVAAFTSDLAPHWATPEFLAWSGYSPLFDRIVRWTAGGEI